MTNHLRGRTVLAAAIAAALAVPAAAGAASSVFESAAKVVPSGQTPTPSWTQADLGTEQHYLVDVRGFPVTVAETNGVTTGGAISYEVLPQAYRDLFNKTRWLAEGATGAQLHATCDVASLTDPAVVLAWQSGDPSFAYIPFQKSSAGVGDDPATWLPTIKAATGLTLTSTTDLQSACEGLGGTFHPADRVIDTPSTLAAGVVAPLNAKIAELTKAKAAADAAKAAADAQVKRLKLEAATFTVTVDSNGILQRGLNAKVSGPPDRKVVIRAQVTEAQRRKLKLRLRTLGIGTGSTDASGKATIVIQPQKDARILLKLSDPLPVTIAAIAGDRAAFPTAYLGA